MFDKKNSWWRGTDILPLKSTRFEVNRDYSLVFNAIELSDLGPYICQAYSGLGKPVSMYVTLKAIGPVYANTPEDEPYIKYIIDAPPLQPTETFYRSTPPVDLTPVGKFIEAFMVWDFSIDFFLLIYDCYSFLILSACLHL